MDPEFLVDGVLRSVLGGRRKRSRRAMRYLTRDLARGSQRAARGAAWVARDVARGGSSFWTRPSTLLGAVGLAWGIFETLSGKSGAGPAGVGSGDAGSATAGAGLGTVNTVGAGSSTVLPPPIPGTPAGTTPRPEAEAASVDAMRLMRLAISAAHADGPMNEQERAAILLEAQKLGISDVFGPELAQPRPIAEIVAGVTDPAQGATLYVLAYTILRADEQVTGAERIYLAQLANLLGLDRATVDALEQDTGERIDALGDQGQLGG